MAIPYLLMELLILNVFFLFLKPRLKHLKITFLMKKIPLASQTWETPPPRLPQRKFPIKSQYFIAPLNL